MARTESAQVETRDANAKKRVIFRIAALLLVLLAALLLFEGFFWNKQQATSLPTTIAPAQETVTDVLLIMSYDENDGNTPLYRNGVLDVMSRSKVGVDVVYMNAYNAPLGSDAYNAWVSQLAQKVAQHGSYGAVICADDEALYFIEQNHDTMFASTPVVFFGVNDFNHALQASTSGYMTGAVEQSYYGSIMQAAMSLQPEATGFVAIVDETPAGIGNQGQFNLAMKNFNGMSVRYIDASTMTRQQLASEISKVGSDSIVMLLDASTDVTGTYYPLSTTASYVSNASNVPVYRASMGGVGNGIAGSGFVDAASDGQKAAETTIQVLNGTRPADIPISFEGNLGYVFDGSVLNDYGISTSSTPAGSTIVNRSLFSLDTLRIIALPAFLLICALLFLRASRRWPVEPVAVGGQQANYQAQELEVKEVTSPGAKKKPSKQLVSKKSKKNKKLKAPRKSNRKEERSEEVVAQSQVTEDVQSSGSSGHQVASKRDDLEISYVYSSEGSASVEESSVIEKEDAAPEVEEVIEAEVTEVTATEDPVVAEGEETAEEIETIEAEVEVSKPSDEPRQEKKSPDRSRSGRGPGKQHRATRTLRQRHMEPSALIALEIINYMDIEDVYGSEQAKECLQVISKRLDGLDSSIYVREQRKGFLIGLDSEVQRGSQEIDALEFLLRQPLSIGDYSITVHACVSAVNRQKNMSTKEMEEGVWFAIDQSKELGSFDSVIFYDSDMRAAMENRAEITELLEQAIEAEDFMVFYQPQVNLDDLNVSGYEALVRLKDKKYPPSQFIPIAEMNGMIVDIDRIVTKRAVEQLAKWKRRNKRMRPISINLSAVHLTKEDNYADYLMSMLSEYNVLPSHIRIEITESFFNTDQTKAEELITSLFQSGITIALDRFGKGFTSFADIMSIPASVVKIDKEFVDTFLVDGSDENFEQLVLLAQGFGKRVVVVGVDNKFQLDICRKLKCDAVQGYYFSRPLLPENAVQYRPK